jgi:uncharacterized membrane protein HdeD (DUF308 family)
MKKGFGWFFSILGGLNIIRGLIMIANENANGAWILFWGIAFIVLGVWMVSSSKPKEKNIN